MRIERYNGGTLRRYHLPKGAVLVVRTDRLCCAIPPAIPHIAVPVDRDIAADALRHARAQAKEESR